MFVILQKYDFSSKSQPTWFQHLAILRCLWYCKSTIFQANHNRIWNIGIGLRMFVILQKYDFSSKSQPALEHQLWHQWCLWYCKSTIFQANHNQPAMIDAYPLDVCDTAKVRFFKQITTIFVYLVYCKLMFVILQKYDFSSKSQLTARKKHARNWCLWYCKSTIFQANHNRSRSCLPHVRDVCDTAKVRFFKQITTTRQEGLWAYRCLWYCKSTIFQANHNHYHGVLSFDNDVCDTAKVRFFKQITTRNHLKLQK